MSSSGVRKKSPTAIGKEFAILFINLGGKRTLAIHVINGVRLFQRRLSSVEKARLRRLANPGMAAADSAYNRKKRKLLAQEAVRSA